MTFLSPWLLFGLLGAAIPIFLHLLKRNNPKIIKFPAIEFLRRAEKRVARRLRAKQLLLMAVRVALCVTLALALSRPMFDAKVGAASEVASDGRPLVFVLDASYPMGYRLSGERLLDRARRVFEESLDHLGQTAPAALVIAGDEIEVPTAAPTLEFSLLRQAVRSAKLGTHPSRVKEALGLAVGLLPAGGRVILLSHPGTQVSDFISESQDSHEFLRIDLANGEPLQNHALLEATAERARELGAGQWRISGRVANFSTEPAKSLSLALKIKGTEVARGLLDLEPGEIQTKIFYARLSESEAIEAELALEPDNLTADDTRPILIDAAPPIHVLAVNGDPNENPYLDELFYTEKALTSGTLHSIDITIVDESAFEEADFKPFDVILMANVNDVSRETSRKLNAFVQAGGGLFLAVGSRTSPSKWNAMLGELLPRRLRDLRRAGDIASTTEGGDARATRITGLPSEHPILSPFGPRSSLTETKIERYVLLEPAPDAKGEVLLTLDDGAPLLITKPYGAGEVALLTCSLDRDFGDLPIRPDFLPLLQRSVHFLAGRQEGASQAVLVGQPAAIRGVTSEIHRVFISTPAGERHSSERPHNGAWQFTHTDVPGIYRVSPPPPSTLNLPGFVVALDALQGDLRAQQLEKSEDSQKSGASLEESFPTECWHWALLMLFLWLLIEAVLLMRLPDSEKRLSEKENA